MFLGGGGRGHMCFRLYAGGGALRYAGVHMREQRF